MFRKFLLECENCNEGDEDNESVDEDESNNESVSEDELTVTWMSINFVPGIIKELSCLRMDVFFILLLMRHILINMFCFHFKLNFYLLQHFFVQL